MASRPIVRSLATPTESWSRLSVFIYPADRHSLTATDRPPTPAEAQARLFHQATALPGFGGLLHQRPEYGSIGDAAFARLASSRCRTHDPANATLFLVSHPFAHKDWWPSADSEYRAPLCTRLSSSLRKWRDDWQLKAENVSYMDRRGGRDHLIIAPFLMWSTMGACSVGFSDHSQLGDATRVGVDGGPTVHFHEYTETLHRSTDHRRGGAWLFAPHGNYQTAPPLSPAVGSDTWIAGGSTADGAPSVARPLLAAYVGGARGSASNTSQDAWVYTLRNTLLSACGGAADCGLICIEPVSQEQLGQPHVPRAVKRLIGRAFDTSSEAVCERAARSVVRHQIDTGNAAHGRAKASFLALYANATFCLMPPGDSPYRLAMVDALTMGCLPVAFHPAQTSLWRLQWASWVHEATIMLDHAAVSSGALDVLAYLRAIPPHRVRRMRRALSANFHTINYRTPTPHDAPQSPPLADSIEATCDVRPRPGRRDDALDVVLRSALRHAAGLDPYGEDSSEDSTEP